MNPGLIRWTDVPQRTMGNYTGPTTPIIPISLYKKRRGTDYELSLFRFAVVCINNANIERLLMKKSWYNRMHDSISATQLTLQKDCKRHHLIMRCQRSSSPPLGWSYSIALTSAQLARVLQVELTLPIRKVIIWLCSTTVLHWIKSQSCHYKVSLAQLWQWFRALLCN